MAAATNQRPAYLITAESQSSSSFPQDVLSSLHPRAPIALASKPLR